MGVAVSTGEPLIRRLAAPLRSPALASAVLFAAGGVGFALGNLLLARILPAVEYGAVALFLALTQFGITLGPLGLEVLVNRHHLTPSRPLLARTLLTSAGVGIFLALFALVFYSVDGTLAAILAVTVVAAALNRVAGAFYQSKRKFGPSLFLMLVHNWVLLCAVPIAMLFEHPAAVPVVLTTTFGYFAAAGLGWWRGLAHQDTSTAAPSPKTMLHEGLSAVGLQFAVSIFFQVDRLVIARTMTIADLATYAVVAALAASPFRMLQVGVGYTLLPRLRASASREAILKLLRREARLVAVITAVAALAVLFISPWLEHQFLHGRYPISNALLYAVILVGFVRVWNGFAGSTVSALGTARQLAHFNLCGWGALAIGVAAAVVLAGHSGLVGIVYGLGIGWLLLALAGTLIGSRAIRNWSPPTLPR